MVVKMAVVVGGGGDGDGAGGSGDGGSSGGGSSGGGDGGDGERCLALCIAHRLLPTRRPGLKNDTYASLLYSAITTHEINPT